MAPFKKTGLALLLVCILLGMIPKYSYADDDDDLVAEVVNEEAEEEEAPEYAAPRKLHRRGFTHPLTDMPDASPGITTQYYFPEYPDQRFPIGDSVTVLCHFENAGDEEYNVTAIMGSLNSPFDFNFHVQNYSLKPIGLTVGPGMEFTFEYNFQIHPNLEPVEYVVATTIFYEDEEESFSSTFFNSTVELFYPTAALSLWDMVKLVVTLVGGGAVVWFCLTYILPPSPSAQGKKAAKRAKAVERGTKKSARDDDWTSDFLGPAKGKKAASGKNK
eukprot:CAMPEP_0113933522 /NCGR_PEP_ID=MMETSP1339-20121228/556_1 /TAXON_ID=94617 /ORGANISM="Fibrocapsa japonica" /LENGTH=273 /DNA_ID=CAMNT_0000934809 /DNA_START=43 /DNA_END=864 /DNA_ORIENTATION=+ /assembly_acc=CAM_ASM_000762